MNVSSLLKNKSSFLAYLKGWGSTFSDCTNKVVKLKQFQENGKNGHTDVVDGRNNEESNEKVQNGKSQANAAIAHENGVNARENAKGLRENVSVMREATGKNRPEENGDSPDDHEKEERRRTAHRVFSKQG